MKGEIVNIQHFCIHDGPGIRTTIFLKGCNLRCFWCHNPESQERGITMALYKHKCINCGECGKECPAAKDGKAALFTGDCIHCGKCAEVCFAEAIEAIGTEVTAAEVVQRILREKSFLQASSGGVTVSGGEPLLQIDFLEKLLARLKAERIHTAIETACCVDWSRFERILPYCDYFLCDLKSADSGKHREAVGMGNELIIENLRRLAAAGKEMEIRTPVIPGFNDREEDISAIWNIVKSFGREIKYSLLPFHNLCAGKYESIGRVFPAAQIEEPTRESMEKLERIFDKGEKGNVERS